jgi:hypothetical protein
MPGLARARRRASRRRGDDRRVRLNPWRIRGHLGAPSSLYTAQQTWIAGLETAASATLPGSLPTDRPAGAIWASVRETQAWRETGNDVGTTGALKGAAALPDAQFCTALPGMMC